MVSILYVVGAPAGDGSDLTRRAQRILGEAAVVVAEDVGPAQRLLSQYHVDTPVIAARGERDLDALEMGDVAFLSSGGFPGCEDRGTHLVRAAVERGVAVVPVPGPVLPITALVISGLPAHSFVYVDAICQPRPVLAALLAYLEDGDRTVVIGASGEDLAALLPELHAVLGNRPLVVVSASELGTDVAWRGELGVAAGQVDGVQGACVLVLGGAPEKVTRWEEDQLRAEIRTRLAQGLRSREISRQLSAESEWPRRDIYRLAVELGRSDVGEGEGI
jgi:16S rRNA (cytidine1402-2'-O)-methyltransferase